MEFLKRKEARIDALKGANVVKFTIEHHKNHKASVFTYEVFSSSRPPELFCHSLSCFRTRKKLLLAREYSLLLEKFMNSKLIHVKGILFLVFGAAKNEPAIENGVTEMFNKEFPKAGARKGKRLKVNGVSSGQLILGFDDLGNTETMMMTYGLANEFMNFSENAGSEVQGKKYWFRICDHCLAIGKAWSLNSRV